MLKKLKQIIKNQLSENRGNYSFIEPDEVKEQDAYNILGKQIGKPGGNMYSFVYPNNNGSMNFWFDHVTRNFKKDESPYFKSDGRPSLFVDMHWSGKHQKHVEAYNKKWGSNIYYYCTTEAIKSIFAKKIFVEKDTEFITKKHAEKCPEIIEKLHSCFKTYIETENFFSAVFYPLHYYFYDRRKKDWYSRKQEEEMGKMFIQEHLKNSFKNTSFLTVAKVFLPSDMQETIKTQELTLTKCPFLP